MGTPYHSWELLLVPGGQGQATLSTSTGEFTLEEGCWEFWADQSYYMEVQAATGGSLSATPTAKPANSFTYYAVPQGGTKYALFKRISVSGTFYANKIAHPVRL